MPVRAQLAALELARDVADPTTLSSCLLARHDVLWSPGNATARLDLAREITELGERTGDDERRVQGLLLAANALLEGGSPSSRSICEPQGSSGNHATTTWC